MNINLSLFALVLKSPDGEWPIKYTYIHVPAGYRGNSNDDDGDGDDDDDEEEEEEEEKEEEEEGGGGGGGDDDNTNFFCQLPVGAFQS